MKRQILSVIALFSLFLNSLQAENFKVNLEDFDVLEIRTSGTIDWKAGQAGCSVDCSAPLFEELDIEQNGRKLIIQWKRNGKPGWKSGTNKLLIHLQSDYLKKVDISGSADLRFLSADKVADFALSINGSGDFSGELDCTGAVSMNVSGSGDLSPSGKCKNLNLSISGSGDFRGMNLISEITSIKISGSGDASVYASEELDASVSGSGDIRYAGNPKKLNKKVSGSGEIQKAN
jgi:hypothetical protein